LLPAFQPKLPPQAGNPVKPCLEAFGSQLRLQAATAIALTCAPVGRLDGKLQGLSSGQ
jgi:hypothetical protein